jgi:hypothetical protein
MWRSYYSTRGTLNLHTRLRHGTTARMEPSLKEVLRWTNEQRKALPFFVSPSYAIEFRKHKSRVIGTGNIRCKSTSHPILEDPHTTSPYHGLYIKISHDQGAIALATNSSSAARRVRHASGILGITSKPSITCTKRKSTTSRKHNPFQHRDAVDPSYCILRQSACRNHAP